MKHAAAIRFPSTHQSDINTEPCDLSTCCGRRVASTSCDTATALHIMGVSTAPRFGAFVSKDLAEQLQGVTALDLLNPSTETFPLPTANRYGDFKLA